MTKPEIFVSIDVETDGPTPAVNSMLSIGAVAITPGYYGYRITEVFCNNLQPLPDRIPDSDTVKWWSSQPDAWAEVCKNQLTPQQAMDNFAKWLSDLTAVAPAKLVAVAWPASFDFEFVNNYMHQFYGENPLGFACMDIRSYANGLFNVAGYYERLPFDLYQHFNIDTTDLRPHVSVDDAIKQGRLLIELLHHAKKAASGKP